MRMSCAFHLRTTLYSCARFSRYGRHAALSLFRCIGTINSHRERAIDSLVPSTTDPQSGQPAFKHVGVDVARFVATTYGFAVLREPPRDLHADYWALAKCRDGWRLELALAGGARDWTAFADITFWLRA